MPLRFSWILSLLLPGVATAQAGALASAKARPFAFTHVTVINMTGAAPKLDMTVLVSATRIAAVRRSVSLRLPTGTVEVDGTGKYLIPGLWDMHVHAAWEDQVETFLPLFLANGVERLLLDVRTWRGMSGAPVFDPYSSTVIGIHQKAMGSETVTAFAFPLTQPIITALLAAHDESNRGNQCGLICLPHGEFAIDLEGALFDLTS